MAADPCRLVRRVKQFSRLGACTARNFFTCRTRRQGSWA